MAVDVSTKYLGLQLTSPLVAAPCPLTGNLESLRELEQAGAAAVVLPSLFEEQVEHEQLQVHGMHEQTSFASPEAATYFPDLQEYNAGPDEYLRQVEAAKQALSIPVIGSLNGHTDGGWTTYAKKIEDAGADALELNAYLVPTDPQMDSDSVERRYVQLVASVCQSVRIPVAVKIGPYFSSLPHFIRRLEQAGAKGVVLFNRFLEPDIDLENLEIQPTLTLSSRYESRLPLRWLAILRDQFSGSLAATSGFHAAEDVLKALLVGADVVMMAATLLRHGPSVLSTMRQELESWLEEKEYESVEQMKGSLSIRNCPDPSALQRANYMRALVSFSTELP